MRIIPNSVHPDIYRSTSGNGDFRLAHPITDIIEITDDDCDDIGIAWVHELIDHDVSLSIYLKRLIELARLK
jgi:hypothetical protein